MTMAAAPCHCATRVFLHVFLFVTNTTASSCFSSPFSSSSSSPSSENVQPADVGNSSDSDWLGNCNGTSPSRGNCQLQNVVECIEMYVVPALIAMGVVGSVLGLVVLLATFLRFKFFSHLLACINLSSAAFLSTVLLSWLAKNDVDVFRAPGLCQVHIFSSHFFTFLTVWCGVLGAYLVLYDWLRPGALRWLHSPTAAKTMVLGLSVLGFTVYSYKSWTHFSMLHRGHRVCTVIPENKPVMEVLNVLDVQLLLVLPSVLYVLFVMIVLFSRFQPRCHDSGRRRRWLLGPGRGGRGLSFSSPPVGDLAAEEEVRSSRRSVRRHWKEVHRLVLSQSACFLLLVTPRAVSTLMVIVQRWVYLHKASTDDILLHHVFQFSFYLYFALLPYCPVVSSDKFRQHCFSLLRRRRRRRAKHIERLLSWTLIRP